MAFNLGSVSSEINRTFSSISTVSQQVSGVTNNINSVVASVGRISSIAGSIDNISGRGAGILNDALGSVGGAVDAIGGGLSQGINNFVGGLGGNLGANISDAIGNITGGAEELSGLIADPIRVVSRSQSEIFNATGGKFDQLRQEVEKLAEISEFSDFINLSLPAPGSSASINPASNSGDTTNTNRIPNPLRNHNSFNYIITLGILSAEEYNNPLTYRGGASGSAGGFEYYIAKSAGGNYGKRWRVEDERDDENAEYFIEDLEFDAVIAPNRNTNVTLGTTISFRIIEPYSMGNFIEAIIGASKAAGFSNYLDAPFCLKFDFVGYDEYGKVSNQYIAAPMFVPMKINKVDFNVSGSGSTYQVNAVPMSEAGLSDNINQIKSDINATGTTLSEVLETSERSVTQSMNERIAALEETGALAPYDRFVVAFPKNRDDILNFINSGQATSDPLQTTAQDEIQSQRGLPSGPEGNTYAYDGQVNSESVIPASRMYEQIKSFVENEIFQNEIGKSVIVEDTTDGSDQSQAAQGSTYDEVTQTPDPAAAAARPGENAREHQFGQGQTITSIIETMLMRSQYGRDRATEQGTNGVRRWFRIDTNVFYEPNPASENQMGRPPKVYVYSVIPYELDEAVTLGPTERAPNTEQLINMAAKEYNYIYTGKNEDVLNFDISFNNAFTSVAFANFGMNSGSSASGLDSRSHSGPDDGMRGAQPRTESDGGEQNEPTGGVNEESQSGVPPVATRNRDIASQVAEMYHNRIVNLPLDMVTAEIEILGDPFFIPQEMGNYVAPRGDNPNASQDGTMTYQRAQVFIVINFRTPFDYQIKGSTMEMPRRVPQFSGLFSVWAVTNNFSGGKFTQTLKVIRRRGQDDEPTTDNAGVTRLSDESAINDQSTERAQYQSQTGNLPNVGYCAGQVDPRLAAAAAQVTAQNTTSAADVVAPFNGTGISSQPVVPIGRVSSARPVGSLPNIRPGDETNALDAIAADRVTYGIQQSVNGAVDQATSVLSNVGFGPGQIDPGLARATSQNFAQSLSPALSTVQNIPQELQTQFTNAASDVRNIANAIPSAAANIPNISDISGRIQTQVAGNIDAVNRITSRATNFFS